jgi:hypothetical protein
MDTAQLHNIDLYWRNPHPLTRPVATFPKVRSSKRRDGRTEAITQGTDCTPLGWPVGGIPVFEPPAYVSPCISPTSPKLRGVPPSSAYPRSSPRQGYAPNPNRGNRRQDSSEIGVVQRIW